jgi:hypothetical protein
VTLPCGHEWRRPTDKFCPQCGSPTPIATPEEIAEAVECRESFARWVAGGVWRAAE